MISKKLFLAAVLIAGLTAAPRAAGACSCTREMTFTEAVALSQQIYVGTVVDVVSAGSEFPYMVVARLAADVGNAQAAVPIAAASRWRASSIAITT